VSRGGTVFEQNTAAINAGRAARRSGPAHFLNGSSSRTTRLLPS
jgi:hypothetical protein